MRQILSLFLDIPFFLPENGMVSNPPRREKRFRMVAEAIENIADRVLAIDEAELSTLLQHYKTRMAQGEPTRAWERAVVAFFLINAVRLKNSLKQGQHQNHKLSADQARQLRLVKALAS